MSTTPDYSASPRKRFVEINLAALPYTAPGGDPFALYLHADAIDGSSVISFEPAEGAEVEDVPIFQQGKFDIALLSSLTGATGLTAAWAAF